MSTYKEKYNKKYGFPKSKSHSLTEISKTTGYKRSGLQTIYNNSSKEKIISMSKYIWTP